MQKQCARCQVEKPIADFGSDNGRVDKRSVYCRTCARIIWHERKPPPRRVSPIVDGKKPCNVCKAIKPLTEFDAQKAGWGKRRSYCKACAKTLRAERDLRIPVDNRKYSLKAKFGITHEIYNAMFAKQNGGCAICGSLKPNGRGAHFHVDHCHDTSRIRGLLCHGCNVGIGSLKHSKAILLSAIKYLAERGAER